MLEVVQTYKEGLPPDGARLLQAINTSAGLLNYQACVRHDESLNQDFLILTEAEQTLGRRYWGTFVLRLGQSRPYAIQVPRPLFDLNSLECGVFLFERLQAESLLLAGSHNEANQPFQSVDRRGSDVLDFRNTANLFTLVNQVIMREAGLRAKMAVQCRGFARNPGVVGGPEIFVAFQDGIRTYPMLTPLGRSVVDFLNEDGFRLQFVDGSPVSAGYEISCVPQAQYMAECSRKEFAIVWLSPTLREVFQPQDDDYPLQVQLKALDIPMTVGDLAGSLKGRVRSGAKTVIPPELKSVLDNYVRTMDIVSLQHAVKQWPEFCFTGLLDRGTRQLVLLISQDPASLPVVLNLRPRLTPVPAEKPADEKQRIELFLASRSTWLEWAL